MYASRDLAVRVALLQAPNDILLPLNGVVVRDINISREQTVNPTIATDNWQRHTPLAQQSIRLRLTGLLQDNAATSYIRKAGIEGARLRMELTWPDLAVSDGCYVVSNYQEYGEPDSVLEYRVDMVSTDTQTITPVS